MYFTIILRTFALLLNYDVLLFVCMCTGMKHNFTQFVPVTTPFIQAIYNSFYLAEVTEKQSVFGAHCSLFVISSYLTMEKKYLSSQDPPTLFILFQIQGYNLSSQGIVMQLRTSVDICLYVCIQRHADQKAFGDTK